MRRSLRTIAERSYDLLIIGGGINGAGVALEATRRGLKTVLLERRDFGGGTTSRSTKLIHGGLRYLEHGEFGLVFESLREREALLRLAPHLVRPLPFLIILHRDGPYRPFRVRLGLTLYDLLSLGKSLPSHRMLSLAEVREREPTLVAEGMSAAFLYFDAQVTYPERLVLENVRAAEARGADVLNYAEVIELVIEAGAVRGARVRDRVSGEEEVIRARMVINAAGPWVDALCRLLPRAIPRQIGGTKGSHLVVPNRWGLRHALYAVAHADGRPFFIVPWRECLLIGTTDIRYEGDADDAQADDEEVTYLLEEARQLLGPDLRREDLLYAYSGVRPLPYCPGVPEGAITRRHIIRDHEREDGLAGFISIIGGKITPYRHLAEEVVALVCRKLRLVRSARAEGRFEPLPGGAPLQSREIEEKAAALGVTSDSTAHLMELYGSLSEEVLALVERDRALGQRFCRHHPDIAAQLLYAWEREYAVRLADIFLRRTAIGWGPCLGLACASTAARLMGAYLGWDESRVQEETVAYRDELARTFRLFAAAPSF
ncbi:MAG: glycerol-3-phosphate dehydrogenase [Blastocatellia bacterium]|nr:glycerol-3-phosphate dehydrogenase [Blastocatellia bacterium]MCS7158193.1 glycerol-3-phosphate dehydrogenase [Blastocatellia bacterium]MCX7752945.1 glycerol-3-phosphate dehydrogenase [Blastocatellia bacterium]MDW8168468.1 glycerol-3-phosphate dehydrogenase [Acidobacteriota bacterium]MDW8256882.1 glycerol-3-phosphate dehydrogenase [Acidobacteriota bacterium]